MKDNRILIELVVNVEPDWELFGILRRCKPAQDVIDKNPWTLELDWIACRACEVVHEMYGDCKRYSRNVDTPHMIADRFVPLDMATLENLKIFEDYLKDATRLNLHIIKESPHSNNPYYSGPRIEYRKFKLTKRESPYTHGI